MINWTYIGALFSVAFGWFLNELGQWFRTRKEDKKIKKQVLYNLLEVYYTFSRLDTSDITKNITNAVLSRIPQEEQTDELKQQMNLLYSTIANNIIKEEIASKFDSIEKKYTEAIDHLAAIDPITAYRLNGRAKIMQGFEMMHSSMEEVQEHFPEGNNEEMQTQITSVINILKPDIIKEGIQDLEEEITNISLGINPLLYYRTKKTIQVIKDRMKDNFKEEIEELINKLPFPQ